MATDSSYEDKIKRAVKKKDVETILRLCDDSSSRTSILNFRKVGKRLVHLAAQFGSVILLEKLRSIGSDLTVLSHDTDEYHKGGLYTTLHIACTCGHIEVVKYLLQNVQDVSFKNIATIQGKDKSYRNAFYYAAQSGSVEVVKCLQTLGKLDINEILPHNRTTLSVVVAENDSTSAQVLCECGANVNLGTFERGLKPIQYIVEKPDSTEIIKVLLNFGANVNELWEKHSRRSWLRQSPLFMALKHGFADNAQVLIEGGANVSFVGQGANLGSISCFSLAAKRCPALIPEFLKHGADSNESLNGQSLFLMAMDGYASSDTIKAFVEAGADVNQIRNGKTLIQSCTCYEQLRPFIEGGVSVKTIESEHKVYTISLALDNRYTSDTKSLSDLLSKGADPNLTTDGKDPPLIVATKKDLSEDVECLIKGGAHLDDVSRDGDTAIVVCCKKVSRSCFQTLNILIESGASLNIASNEGEYPLELLSKRIEMDKHSSANLTRHLYGYQSSHREEIENCVTKMLAKGANPNVTRKGKNSALIIAVQKQSENLVQILLDAGADILHVGENQRTALDLCFIRGSRSIRYTIIKVFVDNPNLYMTSDTVGPCLIDMLIENDVEDWIVEYAVSKGVDANRVLLGKDSPLMKATKRRRYKISCALIEAGANVTYASCDGTSAFDIFSENCKKLQKSRQDADKSHLSKPKRVYQRNTESGEDTDEQTSADILTNLFRCFMVSGIEVNKPTTYGIYPLQIPVWLNSFEMTKWVLEHDADVNIVEDLNKAPLTIALANGHIDIVQLLLDSKANLNLTGHVRSETEIKGQEKKNTDCIDDNVEDSLLTRVIRGHTNTKEVLVKMLLKAGADPNIAVKGDDSPLLHAVRTRNIEIIKILLESGADVKHVGLNSYTALHVYFQHDGEDNSSYTQFLKKDRQIRGHSGPSQILQMLLRSGAPTQSLSVSNELPVHFALKLCTQVEDGESEEDIRLMLDYYKDVNIPDNNGNTLLILACADCTFNIINKIILQGADVNYSGNNGSTAVQAHMESEIFDKEVVSLLIKHGADINKINELGETALIRYIKRGRQHVMEKNVLFLIEVGADPSTSVKDCNSALIEALSLNLFNISICLLKANSDVNHVGANCTTALQVILRKVKTKEAKNSEDKEMTDREYTFPVTTDVEKLNKIRTLVYTVITILLSAGSDVNYVSKDGESPLYMLLKLHDTGLVNVILQLFIEKGADPNKGIAVPLILAAELNRQKAMKILLDAGAMVDKLNQHGETALITSLQAFSKSLDVKNIGTVKMLLESRASFYLKDRHGNIPLSLPFMSGKHALNINPKCDVIIMQMLSTLLENGACPNTQPDGEDTPLMLAAGDCLPKCVKLLLKSGAHSDHIGKDGKTALHKWFLPCRTSRYRTTGVLSSRSGPMLGMKNLVNLDDKKRTEKNRLKILELLLSHRAHVNVDEEGHDSPLLLAIQYEDIEAIKALLKAGSNLSHRGVDRLNAFERCLKSEYSSGLKIFDILLHHQTPEKDRIDNLFQLLWEYVREREVFSKPLLEAVGVKLLSTDTEITVDLGKPNDHDSPLIYFCRLQCLDVVKILLSRTADVNHIGSDGKTVLHTMIDMTDKDATDFQQMVEIIFSAEPNFDIKDEYDKSPIEESAYKYLQQYCHNDSDLTNIGVLVQHLLDAGASLPSSDLDKLLKKAAENGDFKTMESVCRHGANKEMTDKNGNTILHICWPNTLDGALQFLEYYKEEGGFLNKVNKDGNSPLLVLLNEHSKQRDKSEKIETQTANIAAYFMKNTTTVILDKYGNTPLHVAAEDGMVKIIEALLASGAIASRLNKKGRTALHGCLEKPTSNIVEVVSKLIKSENPSVELEVSGRTPLFLATNLYERYYMYDYHCKKEMLGQQSRVVEVLIQHGANPNSHNSSNIPLLSAVKAGDIDTVSLLLEKGALADVTNEKGQSAIHVLFSEMPHISKDAEMILLQLLIDNGISVNATDDEGKSALIVAVERYEDRNRQRKRILSRKSNPSFTNNIINELLLHGADVKAVDKRGRTALNIFCQKGSTTEIGRNLLQAGADPSVGNCLQSVLNNSELRKITELILELLQKGANPNIYSRDGSNLIDVTKKGTKQLVEELLRYGADVNVVDYEAKSALHYACECKIETPKERNDIIRLLITHGAKLNLISSEFRRPLDCLIYRIIQDIRELEILHDGIRSHQYLVIDLSSFNHLVRCGCVLAPIEDIDTTYFHDEYRSAPDFPDETSSFLFLIKHGLLTAATFLLRCGWEIEKEEWIDSYDISKLNMSTVQVKYERCNRINMEKQKADFCNFLATFRKNTRSLSMLCINSIRTQMVFSSGGSEIETKIEALQVPEKIKLFINLTEFMQDEEIIMLEEIERL